MNLMFKFDFCTYLESFSLYTLVNVKDRVFINPILFDLVRATDSSTEGFRSPPKLTNHNSQSILAVVSKFKQSKNYLFNFC